MDAFDLFFNAVVVIVLIAIGYVFVSVWIDVYKWRQKRKGKNGV